MKLYRTIPFLAVFALLLTSCNTTAATPPPYDAKDGKVTITFDHPEKFTDVKDRYQADTAQYLLDDLADYLQREMRRDLPAGQKVSLTFTDIDMAGEFEPWRANAIDVRVVKAIYPPRFAFTYVRTGADGKELAQGKVGLSDLSYQWSGDPLGPNRDKLYYEKEMLRNWMRLNLWK